MVGRDELGVVQFLGSKDRVVVGVGVGRVGRDFHCLSSLRRVRLSALRAGVNQGFELDEWMTLEMSGACLSRILVKVEL